MSGDLIFADRKYRKMGGVWMMQPNTLMRGFIAVAEESTIAMLDEIERLRAALSAIDAEHCSTEEVEGFSGTFCAACDDWWPCKTHRMLHPEGGPS